MSVNCVPQLALQMFSAMPPVSVMAPADSPLVGQSFDKIQAEPGTTARVEVEFEPGPDLMPRDLESFVVRWTVRAGDRRYEQFTPFSPFVPRAAYDPYWGFCGWGYGYPYGPYPYRGWGWGWRGYYW